MIIVLLRLGLGSILLAVSAMTALALETESEPLPLLAVVGVCPADSGWRIVWHPNSLPEQPKAMAVFKTLEGAEFDGCLRYFIESDEKTNTLVSRLRPDMNLDEAGEILRAVHALWRAYGVDRALQEVAETGRRGEEVSKVLRACVPIKPGSIEIKSLTQGSTPN